MMERLKRLWGWVSKPSARWALGTLVAVGLVLGAAGLLAFDGMLAATNTDSFCLSCHELEVNIGREYETMSHARNAAGVRATCGDCHVPHDFIPKMQRKMRAVAEIYHHVAGTIDTPEKFEKHRMTMAMRVWTEMVENDSRDCRTCHDTDSWNLELQTGKAQHFHAGPIAKGKTCIDCHKGVAHSLPQGITPDAALPEMDH